VCSWPAIGRALGFVLACAACANAQTTDPVFAGWSFTPPSTGSRPAGIGGAFVAVADSVRAAVANPAGLTLIPITEVSGATGEPFFGAGVGLGRLRLSGYVARTDEAAVALDELTPGSAGSLESSVLETGIAGAIELHPRVRVGGSLAWTRLRMDGERLVGAPGGMQLPAASVHSDDSQLHATAGLLLILVGANTRALPSLRLGVSYQPGFDWNARMTDAAAVPSDVEIRRPSLVSIGLAWRASDRWRFAGQGDVIRFGEVISTLQRNVGDAADGFGMSHVVEPRVGAEFTAPLWCGCGIAALRGGLHYRSPGTLLYEGPDPLAARAFSARSWRTIATLGASFSAEHFGHALRFDLDSRNVFDGPELSFAVSWRF
jgi:hypothetical protein